MRFLIGAAVWGAMLLVLPGQAAGQPAGQPAAVNQLVNQGQAAGLNPALLQEVVQRAQQAGLDPTQTAQLLRPAVALAQQNLPAQGVLQKSIEGLAKRVPAPRIQAVLQQLQTHTHQAGAMVSDWMRQPAVQEAVGAGEASRRTPHHPLIQSVAQARMQGVSPEAVQRFLDAVPAQTQRRPLPPGEVAAAVQVMPELLNDGVSPEATIDLLTKAIDAGYGPSNLRQLPTAMRAAQRQNQRPLDVLARNAARAIERGTPAGTVLNSLFEGGLPVGPPGTVGGPSSLPPGQGMPPNGPPGQDKGPPKNTPPGNGSGPPGNGL